MLKMMIKRGSYNSNNFKTSPYTFNSFTKHPTNLNHTYHPSTLKFSSLKINNNNTNNNNNNVFTTQQHAIKITPSFRNLSLAHKSFFLLAFIACATSVAFTSLVIATVPMLHAMGRAAISFSKLADTAREELPSTMAAIRLSGMEISDLTLELGDLSHEITEGVNKSTQAVQAAEAGLRHMSSRARQQTMSMIEERANLPNISLQPVVVGAAKKTSRAVGQATKSFINMISGGEDSSDDENANATKKLET